MDYAFIRNDGEDATTPVAVIKDYDTRVLFAHVVEKKGAVIDYLVEQIVEDVARLGHEDIVLRCDQEPALTSVAAGVREARSIGRKPIKWENWKGCSDVHKSLEGVRKCIATSVEVQPSFIASGYNTVS
jgi:hypothetical protein